VPLDLLKLGAAPDVVQPNRAVLEPGQKQLRRRIECEAAHGHTPGDLQARFVRGEVPDLDAPGSVMAPGTEPSVRGYGAALYAGLLGRDRRRLVARRKVQQFQPLPPNGQNQVAIR
jgi:hypothetical protein